MVNFSVFKGLLMALLSGVFFSASAVIVKQMKNIHPGQLTVYRCTAILAFSLPQAVKCEKNLLGPKKYRFFMILRSIFGATGLFLSFIAFRYLPLGEASVIIFSLPVFVTVAARICLKEPCGMFQSLTALMTVVGIIFASKIPQTLAESSVVYTKESIYGLLSAVGSLIFGTCRTILTRKVRSVHLSVLMINLSCVAVLEAAILTAILGKFRLHNCGTQGLYIIILSLLSYGGQALYTSALQCDLAGPVSTMKSASDIVLAFAWQAWLFHDVPDLYSSIGAILVGISVIFLGLNKWVSTLSEESQYRKTFSWILK